MEDLKWDPKGHGGNTGHEGGNTGHEGGNTGHEGGNTGHEGGNTGHEGGTCLGSGRQPENPKGIQTDSWSCVDITWITKFLNSKVGKYLSDHSFITLVLLVFALTASVPIGVFLAFAAVTFITVTVYCIFVEIFLLTIGGVILLCVLCCVAVVAFWISCAISSLYIIGSHVFNFPSTAESTISAGDKERRKDMND